MSTLVEPPAECGPRWPLRSPPIEDDSIPAAESAAVSIISLLASVIAAAAWRILALCRPANTAAAAPAPARRAAATASRTIGDSIASDIHPDFGRKLAQPDDDAELRAERAAELFLPPEALVFRPPRLPVFVEDFLRVCFAMCRVLLFLARCGAEHPVRRPLSHRLSEKSSAG
jgi:hypothetical protein